MKAISLHQPWASMIASGEKTIETRWWRTHYRGDLLICSTKKPVVRDLPLGYALAIVDVYDCVPFEIFHKAKAGFSSSQLEAVIRLQLVNHLPVWSWILEDIRRIEEPFEVTGRQGFFNVDLPGIVI